MTITFEELDERTTRVTLHAVADFDETVRAGAEIGWGTQLDKLAELLLIVRMTFVGASRRSRRPSSRRPHTVAIVETRYM